MGLNNVLPAWLIIVGAAQDSYRDGEITFEEAQDVIYSVYAPESCFKVLEEIREEKGEYR